MPFAAADVQATNINFPNASPIYAEEVAAVTVTAPAAGTVVANWGTLIRTDVPLDYTLVELPVNPTLEYGFLQMRDRGTLHRLQ